MNWFDPGYVVAMVEQLTTPVLVFMAFCVAVVGSGWVSIRFDRWRRTVIAEQKLAQYVALCAELRAAQATHVKQAREAAKPKDQYAAAMRLPQHLSAVYQKSGRLLKDIERCAMFDQELLPIRESAERLHLHHQGLLRQFAPELESTK